MIRSGYPFWKKYVNTHNERNVIIMARRVYMVDTENVSSSWRMMLADMTRNDVLYLFYTEHSPGIGYADFREILESGIQPEMISCYPGKNGLDFQLVSYLGYLLKSAGKTEYFIISNDMGYDSVIRFWTEQGYKVSRITVYDLIQRKKARIAFKKEEEQKAEMEKKSAVEQETMEDGIEASAEGYLKKETKRKQKKKKDDSEQEVFHEESIENPSGSEPMNSSVCLENEQPEEEETTSGGQEHSLEQAVPIQETEQRKKTGRKKKLPVNPVENIGMEIAVFQNTGTEYVREKEPMDETGRKLLAELLASYEDIDVDTVIEILQHGSIRQLQKIYTQMLKLFGHQAGVELYHVLKPHFPVLFTYMKNEAEHEKEF